MRRRHTDVDCCLQRKKRNDPTAEQQSKTVTSMQGNHDAANNYHNEQKNHQKTESQAKFFADDWKNKIGVRIRQIEHLLSAVAQSKPFHPTAAPGDQSLHLLQSGVVLVVLRMKKCGEPPHAFRDLRRNED